MTKYYCDACAKEIKNHFNAKKVSFYYHLIKDMGVAKYVDSEGNATSGNTYEYLLCNHCYNKCMSKAIQEMDEIRMQYGIKKISETDNL